MAFQVAIVPVTPFEQNCALFYDDETGKGAVFDPGGDVERIVAAIEEAGFTAQAIYLTHGHLDHAGGAAALRERLGVEVIGPHEDDRVILDNIERMATQYGLQGMENVTPDRWLEHGDRVTVAGVEFEISHTPGHAPGHVVFHAPAMRFAHVGDVLFAGSIGRTDLPGGDHETLLKSIKDVCLTWPDETQFLCGHGPSSTIGRERASNPFLSGL